jgi:zinc transport system substrate-binding protein
VFAPGVVAADRLKVFVSILPQKYFVEQIGAERVAVRVMVEPGASPHTYEPRPRQMKALAETAVYFAVGVPFENSWLSRISAVNPGMRVVHTDAGIEKIPMAPHGRPASGQDADPGMGGQRAMEPHGPAAHSGEADHEHEVLDPHIWLSPPLVKLQARTIREALETLDPDQAAFYRSNYEAFLLRLDALDARLRSSLEGRQGQSFMVFHPSWGYFARTYGLEQVAIEIEGKEPKPAQLQELIARARQKRVRVIFVQPQFSSRSARLIADAIGARTAMVDPLAADWAQNLGEVAKAFREALR